MYNIRRILCPTVISQQYCRNASKHVYKWKDEGIEYPYFKYFPKNEEFKDPEYQPQKLFRVQRIAPIKGLPYWDRNILKNFKLDGKKSEIAIVKNMPETNALLWRIKHLVKIVPISFPNGFPKDTRGTLLKENGELVVTPELAIKEDKLIATESFVKDSKKLNGDTLRRELRKKWLSGWSLI